MCPKRPTASLATAALLLTATVAAAEPTRLLVITGNGQGMADAIAGFERQHGRDLLRVDVVAETVPAGAVDRADVVFVYYTRNDLLREVAPDLQRAQRRGALVLGAPRDTVERAATLTLDRTVNDIVERYWEFGGTENLVAFLGFVHRAAGGTAIAEVPEPRPLARDGLYHPAAGRLFDDLPSYLAWHDGAHPTLRDAPTVAITFYSNAVKFADTAHLDALIAALEARRLRPLPIFGWPTADVERLLYRDGICLPGVILSLNLTVFRSDDGPALERCGAHVINLMVTRESAAEWAASASGLTGDRVSVLLNTPERSGATEPLLVATTERDRTGVAVSRPIQERVDRAADRAARWSTLRRKANRDKSIAILYYNNPPGRGNLGASYLQVFPTLATLLRRLHDEGYDTGDSLPDEGTLLTLLQRSGRNIELWAPGELDAMVDRGEVTLVSLDEYRRWFAELPAAFAAQVQGEWGPPERSRLMTVQRRGQTFFVVPGLRFGRVFVGPQPLRSTFDRAMDVAHDPLTPVPHGYAAAYLFYRHTLGVDAIVHIGRHGTLEWLPGKQTAQAGEDHAEVLLADLPNPYLYIVDGGGEAIQAKRRGSGVMLSHLTPLIVAAEAERPFDELHAALERYDRLAAGSPDMARESEADIRRAIREQRLDTQLGLDLDRQPWDEIVEAVHAFVHALEEAPIPAGMHALGTLPPETVQRDAVAAFLRYAFSDATRPTVDPMVGEWTAAIFADRPFVPTGLADSLLAQVDETDRSARQWLRHLRASASAEVDALVTVLNGRYLPSGPLGDPLRVPDALPTGRNEHAFDSARIPTRTAWALGQKMAAQMLARFRQDRGRYPEQVSLMLWYGETEKHQGAMESMALALLGVEPVWNGRGTVESLKLIPDSAMTHPRVDVLVTVTGIYRDGFPDKIALLDRAVRLAASAGPSAITRHDDEVRRGLVASGVDERTAASVAAARVFGNKPGQYGIGVQQMVERSLDAGAPAELAERYLHNMNYAFSEQSWGETAANGLASHLRTNDAVLFSRTGNLYGALDNDDTYGYVGGLSLATREASGSAPAFYIHDLRRSGAESISDTKTWLATELNARAWNPKWLREMQRSGYAGAREMFRELEHLYGFQATSPEQMSGQFWQNSYDVYVADKHGLGLDEFFERENPYAKQWMLARLLEVDRQGSYRYTADERARLVGDYVRSVNEHGVSCSANTCGNQRVHKYIASQAPRVPGLAASELEAFGRRVGQATRWSSTSFGGSSSNAVVRGLASAEPRRTSSAPQPPVEPPPPLVPPEVRGFRMDERTLSTAPRAEALQPSASYAVGMLALIAAGAWIEARRRQTRARPV